MVDPPIGGDRSLRRGSFGGGGGRVGDVNRPAGRGDLHLGSCLRALGSHGERAERAVRKEEEDLEAKGQLRVSGPYPWLFIKG